MGAGSAGHGPPPALTKRNLTHDHHDPLRPAVGDHHPACLGALVERGQAAADEALAPRGHEPASHCRSTRHDALAGKESPGIGRLQRLH